jgi:hypothetical protein
MQGQRGCVACAATRTKLSDSLSLLQAEDSSRAVAFLVGVPAGTSAASAAVLQQVST